MNFLLQLWSLSKRKNFYGQSNLEVTTINFMNTEMSILSLWLGLIYVMLICSSFMLLLTSIWKPGHAEFMFWRKKKNNGVKKIFHCWRVTTLYSTDNKVFSKHEYIQLRKKINLRTHTWRPKHCNHDFNWVPLMEVSNRLNHGWKKY